MTAANIIRNQIGHGALYMLGAKNFMDTGAGLQFSIMRNAKKVTHVTVTLASDDTYTVSFVRVGRGYKVTELAKLEGVYVSELHRTIEDHTGLRTKL